MGFSEKTRETVMRLLNHALSEELQLSATTRTFLRHVTGPNFHSLHRLFGDQDRQIERWLADIRARAREVGAAAQAGGEDVAAATRGAVGGTELPARNMVNELLSLHEGVAQRLRADLVASTSRLNDSATADFFQRLVEFHETTAWVLRVLQEGSRSGR
jgi:starvation-inducible DNA-binding protein